VVVDGNVERVVARLHAVEEPLPAARARLHALADELTPQGPSGDFAQAMMDLGATVCTPRAPACGRCPLAPWCAARAAGRPDHYPVKAAKKPRPSRSGTAYWLENDGHVLLVKRPPRGLLGGMLALPTDTAPAEARWQEAGSVGHVFTHFALTMRLLCAAAPARSGEGMWWPVDRLAAAGLPTLFAKLAAAGAEWRSRGEATKAA
jgi:A/G-specific adenine glycosylase